MALLEYLVSRAGGPTLGTWIKLPGVESCEVVAAARFDFAVIDMEHAAIGIESTYRLVMVLSLAGVLPWVRLPEVNKAIIHRLLDVGAAGVLAPHVEDAAATGDGLSFSWYPPRGVRGFATTARAGKWGGRGREEHIAASNADVAFIPQLESEGALARASEIAAVPGLGMVFIGRADRPSPWARPKPTIASRRSSRRPSGSSGRATSSSARPRAIRPMQRRWPGRASISSWSETTPACWRHRQESWS